MHIDSPSDSQGSWLNNFYLSSLNSFLATLTFLHPTQTPSTPKIPLSLKYWFQISHSITITTYASSSPDDPLPLYFKSSWRPLMHWPYHFHNLPALIALHSSLRSLDDYCSVIKSCSAFSDHMDCSMPGSQGTSRVFSSTTIWKHQFFSAEPSFLSNFHIHTWLLENP